jgi:cullin-associated NEDD8-dissociated protein 1
VNRLQGPDADKEVKGKGIDTLGTLLYHAGDYAAGDLSTALSFLRDRLKIEVQRIVTVQTVGFVATSPVLKGPEFDQFVLDSLSEVSTLLRKFHRPLKIAAFETIDALLARAATSGVPSETSAALLQDLEPLLTDHDVNLLPHALDTTAGLLTADPSSSSSQIEETLLPRIYQLVESPLVQGPSLEGLLRFFQAYLKAGADPEPLVKTLSNAGSDKSKGKSGGEAGGTQSLVTASRCIGMIVKESNAVGDRVVKDNEKILKVSLFFFFRSNRLCERRVTDSLFSLENSLRNPLRLLSYSLSSLSEKSVVSRESDFHPLLFLSILTQLTV